MTKVQRTFIVAAFAVLIAAAIYETWQVSHWRQVAQQQRSTGREDLAREREVGARELAELRKENARLKQDTAELIRLRGEVAALRRQQRDKTLGATAQSLESGLPGQPSSDVKQPAGSPRPFQLQLVLNEPGDDTEALAKGDVNAGGTLINVQKTPLLDQTALRSATISTNPTTGGLEIGIELNPAGREQFAQFTRENINKQLAIVMNGKLYAAPKIMSEIPGGKIQVSGSFSEKEARELAAKINEAIESQ